MVENAKATLVASDDRTLMMTQSTAADRQNGDLGFKRERKVPQYSIQTAFTYNSTVRYRYRYREERRMDALIVVLQ